MSSQTRMSCQSTVGLLLHWSVQTFSEATSTWVRSLLCCTISRSMSADSELDLLNTAQNSVQIFYAFMFHGDVKVWSEQWRQQDCMAFMLRACAMQKSCHTCGVCYVMTYKVALWHCV